MKGPVAAAVGLVLGGVALIAPARAADRPGPAPRASIAGEPDRPLTRATGPSVVDQPAELIPKTRPTTKSFYGWQILATEEAGAIFVAAAVFLPERPLGSVPSTVAFLVGMPAYALGGPIVHWTHGDFAKGLVSFGGNAVFAVAGGFIGQARACGQSDASANCGERGFFRGLAVGALIAPLVDTIVLGWEDVPLDSNWSVAPASRAAAERAVPPRFTLAPAFGLGARGSIELGVAGRF